MTARALTRAGDPRWAAPPVRMVHLGLGAFFRAHGAWYTAHAADGEGWGIAAFSGHSHDLVDRMARQDGLYTLTTRRPGGDTIEVVPTVASVRPGGDADAWRGAVADPSVGVVTLTVTEAAYAPGPGSVAARLVDGLVARRAADAGPVSIVPCDNVADNGAVLARLLRERAERVGGDACATWVGEMVAVVGTVVDRITPRPTDADVAAAADLGYADATPVVTEPFSEWILAGEFAADRPDWESAGAKVVDDLGPYARRKLHLLNGAHSLLAYGGLLRGHAEVAGAIADPVLHDAVQVWWDEATPTVGGDAAGLADYRHALVERFGNARMHHRLAQIAIDGAVKLPVRVVPVARAERAAGRSGAAAAGTIGAWLAYCRMVGDALVDARRDDVLAAVRGPLGGAVARGVSLLDEELAADRDFVAAVADAVGNLS